jgi:hypothetical protein
MSELNIEGNIYIEGLTLPNNPGIGTVNCVIGGLSADTPYEFIVVALNQNGYSGYAGPITVYTLSEYETQEQYIGRPPIVAWGDCLMEYFGVSQQVMIQETLEIML